MHPAKKKCVYCGDAPVSHPLHFINASLDIFFAELFPRSTSSPRPLFQTQRSPIARALGALVIGLLTGLRLARFSEDIAGAASERTRIVWREAERRGIRVEQLVVLGKKSEELRGLLPPVKGSKRLGWEYFQSIPVPPWIDQALDPWVDDKATFKRVFERHALPVAKGVSACTFSGALAAFRSIEAPCIVKPREGSRARHTAVDISSEEELRDAYRRAKQLCAYVMVEEFIRGTLYRATCVGGKLVGVIEFVKPVVLADGVRTIEELRAAYNEAMKLPSVAGVKDDAWYQDALRHQGYAPESIQPAGTRILLSEHSERANGGYFIDITDAVPKGTVEVIERAARVCETHVIGFDIISSDLKENGQRFVFIEGNSLPYIEIHHTPYAGSPRDVAGAVWDAWFPAMEEDANASRGRTERTRRIG